MKRSYVNVAADKFNDTRIEVTYYIPIIAVKSVIISENIVFTFVDNTELT